jgi:putative transcriptional regulator
MTRDEFLDGLLLAYAAGNLGTHESLVVATLLALNENARQKVARYEALGGRVLEEESPVVMQGACLDRLMQRIETSASAHCPPAPPRHADIPDPLFSLLCACDAGGAGVWRRDGVVERMALRVAPAERTAARASPARRHLFLMKIPPHRAVAAHRHSGVEVTLVLEGDYSDAFGHYKKGDIAVIDGPQLVHTPVAGARGCLCLVLTHGPLRFVTPVGRALAAFFGRQG